MTLDVQHLLHRAKSGEDSDLGRLLSMYSNYLKIMAQSQLDRRVRRRVSPSDLVQETLMEAHRDFGAFRGNTDAEFVAWLRKILVNNLIRASEKHLLTDKRDIRREVYLQKMHEAVDQSNSRFEHVLEARLGSPSSEMGRHERMRQLADAIAALGADYRQVIVLRHIEGMAFADIAEQMERSSGACRMLWLRAMDQLRSKLQGMEWE